MYDIICYYSYAVKGKASLFISSFGDALEGEVGVSFLLVTQAEQSGVGLPPQHVTPAIPPHINTRTYVRHWKKEGRQRDDRRWSKGQARVACPP